VGSRFWDPPVSQNSLANLELVGTVTEASSRIDDDAKKTRKWVSAWMEELERKLWGVFAKNKTINMSNNSGQVLRNKIGQNMAFLQIPEVHRIRFHGSLGRRALEHRGFLPIWRKNSGQMTGGEAIRKKEMKTVWLDVSRKTHARLSDGIGGPLCAFVQTQTWMNWAIAWNVRDNVVFTAWSPFRASWPFPTSEGTISADQKGQLS